MYLVMALDGCDIHTDGWMERQTDKRIWRKPLARDIKNKHVYIYYDRAELLDFQLRNTSSLPVNNRPFFTLVSPLVPQPITW